MLKVTPDLEHPGAVTVELFDDASYNVKALVLEYTSQRIWPRYRGKPMTAALLEAMTSEVYQQMDLWLEQGRIELAPGGWRCLP